MSPSPLIQLTAVAISGSSGMSDGIWKWEDNWEGDWQGSKGRSLRVLREGTTSLSLSARKSKGAP